MKRPPLTGIALAVLIFSLSSAAFIDGLDFSIANVAVPSIAASFGVSFQDGTSVITLYAISNGIFLAISGWLATRFGSVKVTLYSIALFSLASLLCGLSWNYNALLIFRIFQGIFSGPLITLPQSLLLANCPEEKKGLASGFYLMILIISSPLGPVIGGWITDYYGWRWIFFINVPIGMVSVFFTWFLLRGRENPTLKMPIDILGFVCLIIGLGTLQVFLDRGNDEDWFGSTLITSLAIASCIALLFFSICNYYAESPLIDFSFFKDVNFRIATLLVTIPTLVLLGTTVLIPLYVQTQKGYTPLWAGLVVMPVGILPIFAGPVVGFLTKFVSLRLLVSLSFIVIGYSCTMSAYFTPEATAFQLGWPRLIQGLGIALCYLPILLIALSNIPNFLLDKATCVFNFMRLVVGGGGISTALYVTIWQRREEVHHSHLAEVMHPLQTSTTETYGILHALGVDNLEIPQIFDLLISNQSYLMAFNDLMWISGIILFIFAPFIWLCKEPTEIKEVRME